MTSNIATRNNIGAAPFVRFCRAVAASTRRIRWLVVAVRTRRELARLENLDDRMLADVGLQRYDLRDARWESLWHGPICMLARRAAERRDQPDKPAAMPTAKERNHAR